MMANQPYPDEQAWWREVAYPALDAEYKAVGRHWPDETDPLCFVWPQRIAFDVGEKDWTKEFSLAYYLDMLRRQLHPPMPGPGTDIVGFLKRDKLAYRDQSGKLVLPKVLHAGALFSDFCHGLIDKVRAEMAAARELYDGHRFWDHLGYYGVAWRGKEVTPFSFRNREGQQVTPTPDYYGKLRDYYSLCREYGLKVHHSRGDLNALRWPQIEDHLNRVREIQVSAGLDLILLNEACNEAWQNMPADLPLVPTLKRMCELMPVGPLRVTSAANDDYGGETLEAAREYLVDVAYKHGYRGGATENRLGHIHAFAYHTLVNLGVAGWEGEPAGPADGVTVGREDNVEGLCLMGMQQASFSQGATFMSGAGVFGNSPIYSMPGYRDWPLAIRIVPADVMTFDKIIHGGQTWAGTRIFAVTPESGLRADQRINTPDGRFIATLYGGIGGRFYVERNCDVAIYHPVTRQSHTFTLKAGQPWDVSYERGRYIIGQLT